MDIGIFTSIDYKTSMNGINITLYIFNVTVKILHLKSKVLY